MALLSITIIRSYDPNATIMTPWLTIVIKEIKHVYKIYEYRNTNIYARIKNGHQCIVEISGTQVT